jgi:steroid delta-isomerase-like uncharacterized protein
MSAEENKALARRIYEIFSQGDIESLDQFMASDFVDHNPYPNQGPGLEGVKRFIQEYRMSFANMRFTIDQQVAEGDKVVTRIIFSARHTGEFLGLPATGREVTTTGMDMLRIVDGKIVERWGNEDNVKILQDLGAMPELGGEGLQAA